MLVLRQPREFVEVSPGGRKNAYSGTCAECADEEGDRDGIERSRACLPATGWTGATRTCGRCDGQKVGWWPTSVPEAPPEEAIEQAAWEDHEGAGEEEYP